MPRPRAMRWFAVAVLGLLLFGTSEALARTSIPPGQDDDPELVSAGAAVYAEKCATCHQPGGVGVSGSFPPLAGNDNAADAEYVATVVANGLNEPIEVQGVTYTTVMAAVELSDADLAAVVAYVTSLASAAPVDLPPPTDATTGPASASAGRERFTGASSFENGGAACSSCHTAGSVGNLGGRSLGPDLTDTVATFGGEAGLAAWLTNPPSQTMAPIFGDRPLTADEIADVVAFLADAPNQEEPSYFWDALVWAGLAGLAVLLLGMATAWRGMRQTYVEKLRSEAQAARTEAKTAREPRRLVKSRGAG